MKLSEYYDMLANHDWHHGMSDDPRTFQAGRRREADLRRIADIGGAEWENLFRAFREHHTVYRDGPPLPGRPE
jgi:hypothetical protein